MPKGYPNASREFVTRTPGVAADPDDERDEALDAASDAALSDISDISDVVAAMPAMAPDLKAYIDAQIAAGIATGVQAIRKAQSNPNQPARALPDQSEIDPHSITTMVLTKQGYVVPAGLGAAPAHIREAIQLGR